jgi:hypothetical protein
MMTTKRIEGDDRIAKLFNKYMNLLFDFEIVFSPAYFSMSRYQSERVFEESVIKKSEEMTFKLLVLSNSLKSIRECILEAIGLTQTYLNDYNSDWKYYASSNRLESIQEYGGEDGDFAEDGTIIFKDDNESLKYYTIHKDLSRYIEHKGMEDNGEFIGSSHPGDFEDLSILAKNKNDLSLLSFFRQQGQDIPLYEKSEDGAIKELTTLDRLAKEGYEDIVNSSTVELFNLVLLDCKEISEFYQTINPESDCKEQYTELLTKLTRVLNLNKTNYENID